MAEHRMIETTQLSRSAYKEIPTVGCSCGWKWDCYRKNPEGCVTFADIHAWHVRQVEGR